MDTPSTPSSLDPVGSLLDEFLSGGELGDEKVKPEQIAREVTRLQRSIDDALEQEKSAPSPLTRVVVVHFPPLYANQTPTAFSRVIEPFRPAVCVYGHLHGEKGIAAGFVGEHGGVRYVLASCDAARFAPVPLLES